MALQEVVSKRCDSRAISITSKTGRAPPARISKGSIKIPVKQIERILFLHSLNSVDGLGRDGLPFRALGVDSDGL